MDKLLTKEDNNSQNLILNWRLIWKLEFPRKITIFMWKLLHKLIPIGDTLKKRGINTQDICPICKDGLEDDNYFFMTCTFAKAFWFRSKHTIKIDTIIPQSINGWFQNLVDTQA